MLSYIITVLLTGLSILFTIHYSSVYHIKGIQRGREKYTLIEKIEYRNKDNCIDSSRIALTKSSFKNAMGFFDISLNTNIEEIIIDRYAFIHTCTHNIFAPGKIILKQMPDWIEETSSNEFENISIYSHYLDPVPSKLISEKVAKKQTIFIAVESTFDYPNNYSGPRYEKRLLIFAKGIGLAYASMIYKGGSKDEYILKRWKVFNEEENWLPINSCKNFWEYDIRFEKGPNSLNMREK